MCIVVDAQCVWLVIGRRSHCCSNFALHPCVLGLMWSWNHIIHTDAHSHEHDCMASCVPQQDSNKKKAYLYSQLPHSLTHNPLAPLISAQSSQVGSLMFCRLNDKSNKRIKKRGSTNSLFTTFIISIHSSGGNIVVAASPARSQSEPCM